MNDSMPSDADPTALAIDIALARILDVMPAVTTSQAIDIGHARGRVLANAIHAPMPVPPFRSSAMDGFAFRFREASGCLRVSGESLAGHPGADQLDSGCCQRITTGARVPDDADTVVQQENTQLSEHGIEITHVPDKGLNVRGIGSDSPSGLKLLDAGHRLRAGEIGLLAAHGLTDIEVLSPIRIGLFSTGDELIDPGSSLQRGQIYDANRPLLRSLLSDPCFKLIDLGVMADGPQLLNARLDALEDIDVLLSSGGVSVGTADHVREAIASRGDVRLWKVAMKPGRPLAFGRLHSGQVWFGLPGNPVSSAITTLMFVLPALKRMLGDHDVRLPGIRARLLNSINKRPGRVEFQRGVLHHDADGQACVDSTGLQDSHMLSSLARANCLIELPCDSMGASRDDWVRVHPFTHFGERPL